MFNMIQQQEALKDLPDNFLTQQMQAPSGEYPQFLVLTELQRRKRMRDDAKTQQDQGAPTVAEEMVAAAGIPSLQAGAMSQALAPKTDMAMNTSRAEQPVQMMEGGGSVRLANRRSIYGDGGIDQFRAAKEIEGQPTPEELAYAERQRRTYEGGVPSARTPIRTDVAPMTTPPMQVGTNVPLNISNDVPPMPDRLMMGQRGGGATDMRPPSTPPAMPNIPFRQEVNEIAGFGANVSAPTGVDTTDDARAARGFGRTAYMDGLQEPNSMFSMPSLPDMGGATTGGARGNRPDRDMSGGFNLYDFFAGGQQGTGRGPSEAAGQARAADIAAMNEQLSDEDLAMSMGFPIEELQADVDDQLAAATDEVAAAEEAVANSASASMSASGGGGGGGVPAYSSAEQMLMDRLGGLEQDRDEAKWMAMANFGLGLMTSNDPSFGGAVGEAGLSAMSGYQQSLADLKANEDALLDAQLQLAISRDDQEAARRLATIRAASSRGGGAGGNPYDLGAGGERYIKRRLQPLYDMVQQAESNLETVAQTSFPGDPEYDEAAAALQEISRVYAIENQRLLDTVSGRGGGGTDFDAAAE